MMAAAKQLEAIDEALNMTRKREPRLAQFMTFA
jgi:hypothetical protein